MKNSVIAYVGWLLISAAFAFYAYGIWEAVRLSWGEGPVTGSYNEVLSATIGSMQALLLANFGSLLGIAISNPASGVARQLNLARPVPAGLVASIVTSPLNLKEKVQLFAAVIYIISLLACLVAWIVDDFSSDSQKVISVVSGSGKMFIGVVLAYVTAVLR